VTEAAAEAGVEAAPGREGGTGPAAGTGTEPAAGPSTEPGGEGRGEAGTGRRRGRRGGDGGRRSLVPEQRPWAQPMLRMRPVEVVSEDELEAVHVASLRILRDIGMDFLDAEARRLLAQAGAEVDGDGPRVRFDPEMVLERISTAPSTFRLHARNPDHSLDIGGQAMAFGSVASAPNVSDMDGGRRVGNRADYRNLLKLCQHFNIVHFLAGYPVEPVDLHASVRHLDATFDALTLCDKALHAYSLGRQRNLDCLELVRIARQVDDETLEREPSIFTVINSSSPLRLDTPMLHGMIEYSSRNQVVVMTPFTLAGAMAPVTLAGAVAQQNAEALAGIAFTQVVRPGAPAVYGGFTSNVDMQSGAPAFGTPEYVRTAMLGGQLARRYGLPYRSSNVCAANAVDAQAAYESVFSLWGAVMGGVNLLMHGAGWMEGGLRASYEKLVLDADLLEMVAALLEPVIVDDDTLALDAIAEVGPGGHFFGVGHTQSRYRTAFFRPMISDWRNFESWAEAGRPEAYGRANAIAKEILAAYEPPPMEAAVREELEDFVETDF
jgi:trimethylamine---corrinoid protein Co-methyltransferase